MITKRQIKILKLLIKNSTGITGTMIAENLNVSSRTIRNDISNINYIFKNKNLKINSSNKIGYFINSENINKIKEIIYSLEYKSKKYIESEERIFIILGKILFNGKQNIYDLSDLLHISEQMVYKEFNKLKNFLIENYNYNYIKISGDYIENNSSEEIIRKLFFQLIKDYISLNKTKYKNEIRYLLNENFYNKEFKNLYNKIKDFFEIYKINIDDKSMDMIVSSIYICIIRNNSGLTINKKVNTINSSFIDLLINNLINEGYNITEFDKYYLYDFLWCIKTSDKINDLENISNITYSIINEFCNDVMEKYNFSFRDSEELMDYLTIHIEYMIRRIDMDYQFNNPMLNDIKIKYPFSYEIAILIVHIIYKYKKKYPSDDEISYIAIYVEYYLQMSNKKLKTILINDNSMGINNIIKSWLTNNFSNQIEIIDNINMHHLENYLSQNNIDLIISLRDITLNTNIPSYIIENIPYKNDIELLNSLIHNIKINHRYENIIKKMFDEKFIKFYKNNENFETIIKDMSLNLEKNQKIENAEEFSSDVIYREKIYPTTLCKYLSIPHPLITFAKKTTISIAITDKPIIYNGREMKIIFLLAIENKIDDDVNTLFQFFKQIALDKKLLKILLDINNKKEFIEKIIYISKNIKI